MFDRGWAEAYERAGGSYYPKLQIAVPFTPVPGRRLLARPGPDADAKPCCWRPPPSNSSSAIDLSGVHLTFLTRRPNGAPGHTRLSAAHRSAVPLEQRRLRAPSSDFLASLASRKRKAVRKERERRLSGGLTIQWLRGAAITEASWDAFFAFYMQTGSRKWGRPYLNRKFFSLLGARPWASDCLMILVKRGIARRSPARCI